MIRRATLLVELSAVLAGTAIIAGMLTLAAREHREVRVLERTMAELDLAQNLLDSLRQGVEPPLSSGWRIERVPAGEGIELVTVHGPLRTRLATLRRTISGADAQPKAPIGTAP